MNQDPVKQERCELRKKQLLWLMDNFTGPVYTPDCSNNMASLSDAFNIEDNNELEGYNACGLTMAILNYEPKNIKAYEMSYYGVATFMRNVQIYLPKFLRYKNITLWNPSSWSTGTSNVAESTTEIMDKFTNWLFSIKSRILDDFTVKYLMGGKLQYLEIMKRRYRRQYSDKPEQELEKNINIGNDKVNLNISFSEITKEDESKS